MKKNIWLAVIVFMALAPLAAESIRLISPNGCEVWYRDHDMNITWQLSGTWTGTVKLILFQDEKYKGIIASGIAATDGTYVWKVGNTKNGMFHGNNFRVHVVKEYPGPAVPLNPIMDESDKVFYINKLD
jgi:hypothetical protein